MVNYDDPNGVQYNSITTGTAGSVDMRWAGEYDIGTGLGTVFGPPWPQSSTIRDEDWLMVANKYTSDRPAPQPQSANWGMGVEPTWSTESLTGWIRSATVFQVAVPTGFAGWRVRLGANTTDYSHLAEARLVKKDTGIIETLGTQVIPSTSPAQEWVEVISDSGGIALPGDVLEISIASQNNAGETVTLDGNWIYGGTSQTADPAIGDWNTDNQSIVLRINSTDDDAIDQSTGLAALQVGQTVTCTSVTGRRDYLITGLLGTGAAYSYAVQLQFSSGSINVGDVFAIRSTVSGSTTAHEKQVDYWVGNSPPVWASSVVGTFTNDPLVDPVDDNNAYGADLLGIDYLGSPDWDIAARGTIG